MRYVVMVAVLLVGMVACEDRYRYPCQDPDNFSKAECNPPACEADGTCTKDLIK